MRIVKLSELGSELQALADQHGRARFDAAKSAYMATVTVTDEDGKAVPPDSIEIEATFPESDKAAAPEGEKAAKSTIDADEIGKVIDAAVSRAVKASGRGSDIARAQKAAPSIEFPSYPTKHFGSPEDAHKAGRWVMSIMGHKGSRDFCERHGVKAHIEGSNSAGGFAVPEVLDTQIIRLRDQYGVFPANARRTVMSTDVTYRVRVNDALSVAFVGEAQAASESDLTFTRVDLVAKKLGCMSYISNELSEDAAINIADAFVEDAALAIAKRVDQCGFIGDGTSTYGGFVGCTSKLTGLSGTIANIAGLQVATGTGYATSFNSMVKADFARTVGRAPAYALASGRAKWYMASSFYHGVYLPLVSGQVTNYGDILNGAPVMRCEGYPVVLTEVLPQFGQPAVSTVVALFGDLSAAADFGDRRGTEVLLSQHETTAFKNDQTAARVLTRFAVNVHDVGNASATASARVSGPIVGLITAAS